MPRIFRHQHRLLAHSALILGIKAMTDHGDRPRRQTTESRILAFSRESYRRFEYLKARDDSFRSCPEGCRSSSTWARVQALFWRAAQDFGGRKAPSYPADKAPGFLRAPKLAFSGAAASEVERMQSGASLTHRNYVQIHILNNFCIESYL